MTTHSMETRRALVEELVGFLDLAEQLDAAEPDKAECFNALRFMMHKFAQKHMADMLEEYVANRDNKEN